MLETKLTFGEHSTSKLSQPVRVNHIKKHQHTTLKTSGERSLCKRPQAVWFICMGYPEEANSTENKAVRNTLFFLGGWLCSEIRQWWCLQKLWLYEHLPSTYKALVLILGDIRKSAEIMWMKQVLWILSPCLLAVLDSWRSSWLPVLGIQAELSSSPLDLLIQTVSQTKLLLCHLTQELHFISVNKEKPIKLKRNGNTNKQWLRHCQL